MVSQGSKWTFVDVHAGRTDDGWVPHVPRPPYLGSDRNSLLSDTVPDSRRVQVCEGIPSENQGDERVSGSEEHSYQRDRSLDRTEYHHQQSTPFGAINQTDRIPNEVQSCFESKHSDQSHS
jgi:hypothetical protein